MLSRISAQELAEWQAYYRLEPFGQERSDMQAALIAATIANANRSEDQRPYDIDDFMLRFDAQPQDDGELWQQHLAMVAMLNEAFGGIDTRGNSG